jgi:uncharacterized membrane protein
MTHVMRAVILTGLVLFSTASAQPQSIDESIAEPPGRFLLKVCNTRTIIVILAVRYNVDGKNYVTHGWWQISPRTCQEIAHFRQGHFYMFAQSFDTNPIQVFVHGSDLAKFCVTLNSRFSYSDNKSCGAAERRDFSHLVVSTPTLTWNL